MSHQLCVAQRPEEGAGSAGLVEQKAKRLGKLSTRRCEPDLWMQIQ